MAKEQKYLSDDQKAEELAKLKAIKNKMLMDMNFLKKLGRVMNTEDGKDVVSHMIKYCDPYGEGFTNSGVSAYNAGKQSVGRYLIKQSIRCGNELAPTECIDDLTADDYKNAINNLTDNIHTVMEQIKKL